MITRKKIDLAIHTNSPEQFVRLGNLFPNIDIFYTDVDTFSEEDYEKFKTEFSFDGSTPTTIFFNDGEEKTTATRIEGNVSTEKVINKLKKNGFIK